jgi:hypothetical protein
MEVNMSQGSQVTIVVCRYGACRAARFKGSYYCLEHARTSCRFCAPYPNHYCSAHRDPQEDKVLKRSYLILNDDRLTICGRHEDHQAALREAERIAKERPGEKFLIWQLLTSVTVPAGVVWEQVAP